MNKESSGTYGSVPTRSSMYGASSESNVQHATSNSSFSSRKPAEKQQQQPPQAQTIAPLVMDESSSVNDFFFTFDTKTGNVWGLVYLLAAFFVGSLGWSYLIVVLMAWSVTVYCFRQTRRKHRSTIFDLQTAMQDPDVARRIMGPYLPQWLSFASVEKSTWLQDLINNMWPNIAAASRESIIASVDPLLEYYRPKMLVTSLTVGFCNLGTIPPVIDGVQAHRSENDSVLDLYFHWNGNPDIRITAKAMGVEVDACICNLSFQSVIRIFLGPHCNAWPCFGCFSMCFVGKPLIDFSIKAAKIPLEAIPGLSNWLDGFLRYTLSWSLVYPKRLVFPMFNDMKDMKLMETTVDPVGRLTIRVLRADRLPSTIFQTRRTYVEGKRTNGDPNSAVSKRTKSARGKTAQYNEELVFTVYNAPNERIELTVFTDEPKPPVIGNLLMTDNVIGVHAVAVAGLLSREPMLHNGCRLVNPQKTSIDVGTVTFESEFAPFMLQAEFALNSDDMASPLERERSLGGSGSMVNNGRLSSEASGVKENDSAMMEPAGSPTRGRSMSTSDSYDARPRRSASMAKLRKLASTGKSIKGILIINLVACANLMKIDMIGSADPYVKLRVGTCMEKTEHINDTLNPQYDVQKQLDVADIMRDVLDVEVHDYDKIKINKRLLGKVAIPIRDIFEAGCSVSPKPYLLDPKGTVTLGLKLMIQS